MSLKEAVQMQVHLIRLLSLSLLKWQKLLLHFYWITRNAALLWQSALSKQSLSSSFTLFCLILSSLPPSLSLSLSFSISLADFPLSPVSSISLSLFADGMSLGGRQSALSVECERGQRFQPCADYSKSSFPRVQEIHRQCVSKPFFEGSHWQR